MSDALTMQSLTVRAGHSVLVENLSLRVGAGEFVALIGPNGAGKTTLIRAALGLAAAASGAVELGGHAPRAMRGRERAALAAWLPQSATVAEPITALDLVVAARFRLDESHAASREAARAALLRVGAGAYETRPVTQLSGGEQQRVAIAALIAQEAPLLLLDEPANHLDPALQVGIYRLIGELWREGRAVLCVTHDLNLLRFAAPDATRVRVAGLAQGRLQFECALSAADLPGHLEKLFNVRIRVYGAGNARLLVTEDVR